MSNVSGMPAVPPPAFLPPDPDGETAATSALPDDGVSEATTEDIEEEVDVVSRINDPAHDDVFKHLRPPKD